MGTDARQSSTAACGSGISAETGLSATASVTENGGPVGEGAESSCSDAAQQRSASAWLTTRFDSSCSESDLCIEHGPSSEQQAMRASAVGIQPAQTPAWPTASARVRRTAERRLLKRTVIKDAGGGPRCQIAPMWRRSRSGLKQRGEKLASAWRTSELHDHWTRTGLDRDLKTQELAALALHLDRLHDESQCFAWRPEYQAVAVRDRIVHVGSTQQFSKQFFTTCRKGGRTQRAGDRKIRHPRDF